MLAIALHGDQERHLHEAVKVKPGLPWRTQDVSIARVMGRLMRSADIWVWDQPTEKNCVVVNKVEKGDVDLKNALTSHIRMQRLEFSQLLFCLALGHYFLTMLLLEL